MSQKISKIDYEIVNNLFNENIFKEELIECLNTVIDKELEKDIINDEIISEAVNVINLLDEGKSYEALVLLNGGSNVIQYVPKRIRFTFKRAIAAAIVAVMVTSAFTYQTVPAFAYEVNHVVSQVYLALTDAEDKANDKDVDTSFSFCVEEPDIIKKAKHGEIVAKDKEEIQTILNSFTYIKIDGNENETEISAKDIEFNYTKIGNNIIVVLINYDNHFETRAFVLEG